MSNGLPPRPGSAASTSLRPSTASGRSYTSLSSYNSSELASGNAMLQRHVGDDSLLRILSETSTASTNNAVLFAETGNLEGIRQLLQGGVDLLSIRGLGGYSLLHYACNRGHAGIVAELLKVYFPINLKNESGETPLHLAVYSGNLLVVEQLLDRGADIDSRNNYGETPLFYAARKCFPALVRLLLQRGADMSVEDETGDKAVDHAGNENTSRAFEKMKMNHERSPRGSSSGREEKQEVFREGGCGSHNTNYGRFTLLSHGELFQVFLFLTARDLCRAACVCGKWHRVAETESLWEKLGIRRWERALQSSLGFEMPAMSSFRLRRPNSGTVSPSNSLSRSNSFKNSSGNNNNNNNSNNNSTSNSRQNSGISIEDDDGSSRKGAHVHGFGDESKDSNNNNNNNNSVSRRKKNIPLPPPTAPR